MSAKRKDAFYFSHDSNAKDDPKIVLLIESLGLEGYGIYWVLVEILRDQEDFRYPMSLLGAIARKYNSTADKVKAVVINYNLFQFDDDDFFYSKSLKERMLIRAEIREKRSIAGKISAEKRSEEIQQNSNTCSTHVEHMSNTCSTHPQQNSNTCSTRKGKERKGKETVFNPKGSNTEEKIFEACGQLETVVASASETHALEKKILSFDERAEMHKHENPLLQSIEGWCKMYDPQLDAKAFFDFWESSRWLDSNARPVHWQSKIKFAKKDNAFRFTAKKMSEITEQEFEIILEETRIRNAQWR